MGGACSVRRVSPDGDGCNMRSVLSPGEQSAEVPKIIFLGLDGSGKTTLLEWLLREYGDGDKASKPPQFKTLDPVPTPPKNETVLAKFKSQTLFVDVPGERSARRSWLQMVTMKGVVAVAFVIDVSDILRFALAQDELFKLIMGLDDSGRTSGKQRSCVSLILIAVNTRKENCAFCVQKEELDQFVSELQSSFASSSLQLDVELQYLVTKKEMLSFVCSSKW